MSTIIHPDQELWRRLYGADRDLTIGLRVKLRDKHKLNEKWRGLYLVAGLLIDKTGRLDITITSAIGITSDSALDGLDMYDGWRAEDFVPG